MIIITIIMIMIMIVGGWPAGAPRGARGQPGVPPAGHYVYIYIYIERER